jgi:hypothetical protein
MGIIIGVISGIPRCIPTMRLATILSRLEEEKL